VGIFYRLRQFGQALLAKTDRQALDEAREWLTPKQWELFERLQPAERNHALRMLRKLRGQGDDQPDLLVAALLHDVGKLFYRLNPVERAMIVLARATMPRQARRWGDLPQGDIESLPWWRKAFALAEQHAMWGAELARQAGASLMTEILIREHHHPQGLGDGNPESNLRYKLWRVDNES